MTKAAKLPPTAEQILGFARLNQGAAANLVGYHPRAFREIDWPRNEDGSYNGRDIVAYLKERLATSSSIEDVEPTGKRLRDQVDAEIAEMKRDKMAGRLVDVEQVSQFLERIAGKIRSLGESFKRQRSVDGRNVSRLVDKILDETDWKP